MGCYPRDYKIPKSPTDYFKPEKGKYRLRILTPVMIGWLEWVEISGKNTCLRYPEDQKPAKCSVPGNEFQHFNTFVVWNYNENRVQIWEIVQKTIQHPLRDFELDEQYGDLCTYDIELNKRVSAGKTTYFIDALKKSPIEPEIVERFKSRPCDLTALYRGEDPFNPGASPRSDMKLIPLSAAIIEEEPAEYPFKGIEKMLISKGITEMEMLADCIRESCLKNKKTVPEMVSLIMNSELNQGRFADKYRSYLQESLEQVPF